MDKKDLVGELQKAFNADYGTAAEDIKRDEFKENTKTLWVHEDKTSELFKASEPEQMSEEEVFSRLLKERRESKGENKG